MSDKHLEFEAKTDRELLLLTATTVNDLAEEKIPELQKQITSIELAARDQDKRLSYREVICEQRHKGNQTQSRTGNDVKKVAGIGGGSLGGAVLIVYFIGKLLGWW
jgi:formylmethanofuran dehydrogenase subunit C